MSDFTPKFRMIVMSDIHVKEDNECRELARLRKGLDFAYNYAENSDYNKIDAFVAVGDFANSGREQEMLNFKEVLDEKLKPETDVTLIMASHEYHGEGEEAAKEKLKRIFGMHYDAHKVINGFHLVAVSCTRGCHFDDPQREFVSAALKEATADAAEKPIFFFQHPHVSGTVYGSINWGEDEMNPILMNYPQIIDFSGHSHAPINDPRSIHQEYFTCLGTGSLSYFELDEFDKPCSTIPEDDELCAQYLIVEADENNRVRVYPVDILTNNFFHEPWKIDVPSDPSTFTYTDKRYFNAVKPYFSDDAKIETEKTENGVKLTFPQAKISEDRVDDYVITIRNEKGYIVKQIAVWSHYYLYNMPETISVDVKDIEKGNYTAEIKARGFWKNVSDNSIKTEFTV